MFTCRSFLLRDEDAGPSRKIIKMEGVKGEVENEAEGEGGSAEAPIFVE